MARSGIIPDSTLYQDLSYLLVILVPILILSHFYPGRVDGGHVNILASLLLLPDRAPPALFVAWTLVFELFFYVAASFIFYIEGTKRILPILSWAGVIVVITALHPSVFLNPWLHVWFSPLCLEFISGMLLAHLLQNRLFPIKAWICTFLVTLALASATFFGIRHGAYTGEGESYDRILVYGLPAILIVWMVLQMELQERWGWLQILAPLGDRSYSAYLLHAPILALLMGIAGRRFPHADSSEALVLTLGFILFLAFPIEFCYRLVEKPSHHWGKYFATKLQIHRRPTPALLINSASSGQA